MSIVELQKKARRLGEIRLGDTQTKNGKTFPVSLDTFRLTSTAKGLLDQAAVLWGGKVVPWQASPKSAAKWQVVTDAAELPVYVAPQDPDSVTWYESWTAAGLQRRCDGENIVNRGDPLPCVCDPNNRECRMTTRLQVMLPDLPDVGVWTLSSTGYYAAAEMAMSIQIVMSAAQKTGALPEAVLAIEHREKKEPGKPTKQFVVPVLRFADTLSSFMDEARIALPSKESAPSLPSGADVSGEGAVEAMQTLSAPPPTDVTEPEVVEVVEEPEPEPEPADDQAWSDLLALLEQDESDGTMQVVEARIRKLFRLMDQAGLWPDADRTLHASLMKHDAAEHVGDLRKAELGLFATDAFAAAREKVKVSE